LFSARCLNGSRSGTNSYFGYSPLWNESELRRPVLLAWEVRIAGRRPVHAVIGGALVAHGMLAGAGIAPLMIGRRYQERVQIASNTRSRFLKQTFSISGSRPRFRDVCGA
jgi:hypothetical protein